MRAVGGPTATVLRLTSAAMIAHPRHVVLAALVGGIVAGAHMPLALPLVVVLGAGAAARAPVAVAVVLAAAGGAIAGHERLRALERSALGPLIGHVVEERATLIEPARPGRFGRATAAVLVRGEPVLLRGPGRGRWTGASPGAVLRVRGTLREPDRFVRRRGAHATLRAQAVMPTGTVRGGPMGAVDAVRGRAEHALALALPPAQTGLLRGMVLGQDHALPESVREDFRAAGLAHLVAASGQNVMLLAALALACGALLGLGLRGRLWLVLALIALYVPLAGAGPSIQRAGVMGAAGVLAAMAGRPASRWYALLLAAAVTLALDPRALADPGWQMSFAALVAILALCPRWRDALVRRAAPRGLAEATALAAAATLATAPIVAWHFDRVSLVSLPANVLAAPAVAPIMWLGMCAAAIGQVVLWTAAAPVALAGLPLGYLTWLADAAASLPAANVAAGPWPVAGAVALILAATASRGARRGLPALIALGLAVAVALRPAPVPPPDGLRVTFLDVGQGDATLVQDRHSAVLVDTGPRDGGVVGRLRRAAVERLDALVVTHAQADHQGAAAAVLRALPVGVVLDGRDGVRSPEGDRFAAAASARGVRLVAADAGQVLRAGKLELRVLHPRREPRSLHAGADPNERAVVSLVRYGRVRVLLTADAESEVLSALDLPAADVMKVSHHGSADPGLPALLRRVRPAVAVISVGARNRYGHPAPPTLRALDRAVPSVHRTDRDGSVRIDARGSRLEVSEHA